VLLAWLPVPAVLVALRNAGGAGRIPVLRGGLLLAALAAGSWVAAPPDFYRGLFEKRFGRVIWFGEGVSETVAVCDHGDGSRWIQLSVRFEF